MNFRIFLKKWFDTPSFLIGDKVIIWPGEIKGTVLISKYTSGNWQYYILFNKPTMFGGQIKLGWWLSNTSLTKPYLEDLLKWEL